ncbi:MAG: DUF2059 domain-containing protein [Rikenellaceae bacterium]
MKRIFIVTIATLCLMTSEVNAQSNNSKYKEVLKTYMEVSGSNIAFDVVMDQLIQMLAPSATPEKAAEIKAKIQPQAINSLIDILSPVYEKNLSLSTLEESVKFYNTPAGKEIAKAQKPMAIESMQVGQQWALGLQELITNALK